MHDSGDTIKLEGNSDLPARRSKEATREEIVDITEGLAPKQGHLHHPRVPELEDCNILVV